MTCRVCEAQGRNHLAGEHRGGLGRKREARLIQRQEAYEATFIAKPHRCGSGYCAVAQGGYEFHKPGGGK